MESTNLSLKRRMRRLRRTRNTRALLCETLVTINDLIMPMFVLPDGRASEPIASMPGINRLSIEEAVEECRELASLGIKAIALFPCTEPKNKDSVGSHALADDNLVHTTIRRIKDAVPEMIVISDVALDPYTDHGHDGLLTATGGDVDNDATVDVLAEMAVKQAEAGADWVAPSDMMDGRVGAIRRALDDSGFCETSILAYSAKFASAFYGPFRDAIGSQSAAGKGYLDKGTYQLNPANRRESVRDALLDEEEGADMLMVKPVGPYLDVLHELRNRTELPLVGYQVSGEYAQIQAAAEKGWLDLNRTRDESLLSIKRAGADLIISYFAKELAQSGGG
jgi:porphobilinogen synthase